MDLSLKFTDDEQPAHVLFFLNPKTTAEFHGWLKKSSSTPVLNQPKIKSFNDSYCFTCPFYINGVGIFLPQRSN